MKGLKTLPEWRVKLEIIPKFKVVVNPQTGEEEGVDLPTQYEFTVTDAIEYIVGKRYYFWLEDMLLHNINMRNAIREFGARTVVKEIMKIMPANQELRQELNEFAKKHRKGSIGDYDIQVRSIDEDVTFFGHTLHGLKGITSHLKASLQSGSAHKDYLYSNATEAMPKADGKIHVGSLWHQYPCFDIFDIWNENRYYENYIIRDRQITIEDLYRLDELPGSIDDMRVTEFIPLDMLPMVYYSGEGHYMLVATQNPSLGIKGKNEV